MALVDTAREALKLEITTNFAIFTDSEEPQATTTPVRMRIVSLKISSAARKA